MNTKEMFELLTIQGVSGRETEIAELVLKRIEKNNLDIFRDNLGSVYGYKKSKNKNAKTIMIDAHMDEVGFYVNEICENGLIILEPIGGLWKYNMPTQRLSLTALSNNKKYSGVLSNPLDLKANPNEKLIIKEIDEMFFDLGTNSREEVKKLGINIGDPVVFETTPSIINDRVIGKAVDNRAGVYIVMQLMDFIKNTDFDFNILIGCSTQEEVGLRGAKTATFIKDVDLAIVVDISPSKDFPKDKEEGTLGKGTLVRHFDRMTLTSKRLITYQREILTKKKIQHQDYFSFGGTNAGAIHLSKEGIPCLPIGFVARNLHTGSTIFDTKDLKNTLELSIEILKDLTTKKIQELTENK